MYFVAHVLYSKESLSENLKHPNEDISTIAAGAMRAFGARYYHLVPAAAFKLLQTFIARVRVDELPGVRRGYALALAAMPAPFLSVCASAVVRELCAATELEVPLLCSGQGPHKLTWRVCEQEDVGRRDAESRRNAVTALADVVSTLGVCHDDHTTDTQTPAATEAAPSEVRPLGRAVALSVMRTLLRCLTDYATDDRGDVGRWVREAGMRGLLRCALLYATVDRTQPGMHFCRVATGRLLILIGVHVQIASRCCSPTWWRRLCAGCCSRRWRRSITCVRWRAICCDAPCMRSRRYRTFRSWSN